MAKLDFTNQTHRIPCRVFGADRKEYHAVTKCDTETGVLEQHLQQPDGSLAVEGDRVLTRMVLAQQPLTIEDW